MTGPYSGTLGNAKDFGAEILSSVNTENFQGDVATGLRQFSADSAMVSDNLHNNMDQMNTTMQQYTDRVDRFREEMIANNQTRLERDADDKTMQSINSLRGQTDGETEMDYTIKFGSQNATIPAGTPKKDAQDKIAQFDTVHAAKQRDWEKKRTDFHTMTTDVSNRIGALPTEEWIKTSNGGVRPPLPSSASLADQRVRRDSMFLPSDFQSGVFGAPPMVGGKSMYEYAKDPTPAETSSDKSGSTGNNAGNSSSNPSPGGTPGNSGAHRGGSSGSSGGDRSGGSSTGGPSMASAPRSSSGGSAGDILEQLRANSEPVSSSDTQTGLSSTPAPAAGLAGAMPGAMGTSPLYGGANPSTSLGNNPAGSSFPGSVAGSTPGGSPLGSGGIPNNMTQLSKGDLERMLRGGGDNTPTNLQSRHDNPHSRGSSDGTSTSRGGSDRNKDREQVVAAPTPMTAPGMGGIRGLGGAGGMAPGGAGHPGGMGGMGPGMMGGAQGHGDKRDGKKIQSKKKDILGSDISTVSPVVNASLPTDKDDDSEPNNK